MLLDGDVHAAGVAGDGEAQHVGGYAGKRGWGEGDRAVEGRGGRGRLRGQQFSLGAAAMRGAGRRLSCERQGA